MREKYLQNARKPKGIGGHFIMHRMNKSHQTLANWGLAFLSIQNNAHVLDIGCGGGANISTLLKKAPEGIVDGVDYAKTSVVISRRKNKKAIKQGRSTILQAAMPSLPFADNTYDIATAFETIYFWPQIEKSFEEVYRLLKQGGFFFICNEIVRTDNNEAYVQEYEQMLNMTVYTGKQLEALLSNAKFSNIHIHENKEENFLCVTAQK